MSRDFGVYRTSTSLIAVEEGEEMGEGKKEEERERDGKRDARAGRGGRLIGYWLGGAG